MAGSASIVLVSVPTPVDAAPGGYNLGPLTAALTNIGASLRAADEFPTVVLRSTVPPGTCDGVARPLLEEHSGLALGSGFGLASNPEFLRAECALEDFLRPRFTVVASRSKATRELLASLYSPLGGEIRTYGDPAMAEMIKVTHNLFNAAKISFFNEVWSVAEALGLDGNEVGAAVSRSAEASWNPEYGIRGGRPFGGSCLPKDTRGFVAFGREVGLTVDLAAAVEAVNERMKEQVEVAVDLRDGAVHSAESAELHYRRL